MKEFYSNADIDVKRKLLSSTFPGSLIFSRKNSRTLSLNKAILLIISADKGFIKQKTGELFKNLTFTGTVESDRQIPNTILLHQNDICLPAFRQYFQHD